MAERLGFDRVLHMLRNPYGFKAEELRRAHLEAADRLEGLQDAYLNMRNWAEQNGLDTVARGNVGVQSGSPTSQHVTPTTVLSACPGNGPSCPNACSCAAYAGKCEPASGVEGREP